MRNYVGHWWGGMNQIPRLPLRGWPRWGNRHVNSVIWRRNEVLVMEAAQVLCCAGWEEGPFVLMEGSGKARERRASWTRLTRTNRLSVGGRHWVRGTTWGVPLPLPGVISFDCADLPSFTFPHSLTHLQPNNQNHTLLIPTCFRKICFQYTTP